MGRSAALIVGGGPAGSAAAIALARGGAKPLLLERQRETGDALCGGFLSWRSLETLAKLGVMIEGHAVDHLRIFSEHRVGQARLPGGAIGVSRRRLDTVMLARARSEGARIEHGVMAAAARPGNVTLGDGAALDCDALFLATGKHDCRGLPRPRDTDDPALGLRLRLPAASGLARLVGSAIELHLFRGGYAGLLLQEDGSANLCMAVRKSRLRDAGSPTALLSEISADSPRLGERLAFAGGLDFDAIGAVPYGWRARDGVSGLFRLGDQAAVIPSLAGEGMGIALASGAAAARRYLDHGADGAPAFQRDLARATARPVGLAARLRNAGESRLGRAVAPFLTPFAAPLAGATRIRTITP